MMLQSSIWSAALEAAGCCAHRPQGSGTAILWCRDQGRLRFIAAEELLVEPLNVHLHPGDTLEVDWLPGDSAYTLSVLKAP